MPKASYPFWKVTKIFRPRPKLIPPLKDDDIVLFTPEEKVAGLAEQFTAAHRLAESLESPFKGMVITSIPKEQKTLAWLHASEGYHY